MRHVDTARIRWITARRTSSASRKPGAAVGPAGGPRRTTPALESGKFYQENSEATGLFVSYDWLKDRRLGEP